MKTKSTNQLIISKCQYRSQCYCLSDSNILLGNTLEKNILVHKNAEHYFIYYYSTYQVNNIRKKIILEADQE